MDGYNGKYSLLGLFMLVYFVSYGANDLSNLFTPTDSYMQTGPARGEGLLSKTELLILAGGIVLVLGYRVAVLVASVRPQIRNPREWSTVAIWTVGPLLWILGTISTYRWHVYVIPDTTNEAHRRGLESIGNVAATVYVIGNMMQPLGILLLAYAMKKYRSPYLFTVVIAAVVLQIFIGFVVDIKGLAMLGAMLVIVTSILLDNRLPKGWLAFGALFVIFIFPVFQAYRAAIHGERGLARTAVIQNFTRVLELTLAANEKVNRGPDRAQTFFERSSLKGSTEIIVEKTGNGVDFQHGHTLSPILMTFVPKLVWSDKREVETGQLVSLSNSTSPTATTSSRLSITPGRVLLELWLDGGLGRNGHRRSDLRLDRRAFQSCRW